MLNLHPPYLPTVDAKSIFWEADAEPFVYTYISPEAEELLGYPLSDWLELADFWSRHIHPDERVAVKQDLALLAVRESQFVLSYRWQLANGRWVWLEDRIQVVRSGDSVLRLLGTKQIQSYISESIAKRAVEASDAIDYINHHLFVQGTFQERLASSLEVLGTQLDLESIYILENRFDNGRLKITSQYQWGEQFVDFEQMTYAEIGLETAVSQLQAGQTVTTTVRIATLPQASIAAPIIQNEQWLGSVVCNALPADRQWLSIEKEAVMVLAQLLSTAFRNVRSYEQTQQQLFETTEQLEEAETLNEIAAHLNSAFDLDQVLQKTVDVLRRYLADVQSCGLSILEDAGQAMRMRAQWLEKPDYALHAVGECTQISETFVTRDVLAKQKSIVIVDLRDIYFHDERTQSIIERGLTSLLYVPIIFHNTPIGIIHINAWHKRRQFTQHEIALCEAVANQTAVAIERANLYERLQIHVNHLAEEVASRTVELKAERDRSLAVLENAGEGILVTDVETKITYVNPAIEYQTGYSRAELIGQLSSKILSEQNASILQTVRETIEAGKSWSGELVGRRKNGSLYDVNLTITPTRDAGGEINSFVTVQADISRLKEIDRLKSEFVSNVSHELRTPLTNIKTYLSLLERGKREKFPRYLQVLNHEAVRLERLIQDLLNLSRLETESLPERIESVALKPQVFKLVDTFAVKVRTKQISLQIDIPDDLPLLRMAENHLGQLLTNLVGNAIAYTIENGKIIIAASIADAVVEKRMAHIIIQDNGPGIPQEEQAKVFDRFYRGKQVQMSREVPGTGLGLSICKEIVQRYGGRIELQSKVGEGTTFLVKLPVAN